MEQEGLLGRAELGRLLGVADAARAAAAASSVRQGKGEAREKATYGGGVFN